MAAVAAMAAVRARTNRGCGLWAVAGGRCGRWPRAAAPWAALPSEPWHKLPEH